MQKFTHPQVSLTLIRTKDGSFYSKNWLYFRDHLLLESDINSNKIWTSSKLQQSDDMRIDYTKLYNFKHNLLIKKVK